MVKIPRSPDRPFIDGKLLKFHSYSNDYHLVVKAKADTQTDGWTDRQIDIIQDLHCSIHRTEIFHIGTISNKGIHLT